MNTPAGQAPRLNGAAATAETITAARLIAIIRTDRSEDAVRAIRALAAAGVQVAEISLSTPDALEALERSAEDVGDRVLLGAGTVRSERDAARAMSAGACFLVSPSLDGGVVAYARDRDVLHLPGVMSPTELAGRSPAERSWSSCSRQRAWERGTSRTCSLRFRRRGWSPPAASPTPNFRAFLDAGSVAIAVGSALVGPATIADSGRARRPRGAVSITHRYPHPRREILWRLKASFRSSPRRC